MRDFNASCYNTEGVSASEVNDGSMDVVDLEVYKVSGSLKFLIKIKLYLVN